MDYIGGSVKPGWAYELPGSRDKLVSCKVRFDRKGDISCNSDPKCQFLEHTVDQAFQQLSKQGEFISYCLCVQ